MLNPFLTFQRLQHRPLQSNIILLLFCTSEVKEWLIYFKHISLNSQPKGRQVILLSFIRGRKAAADIHSSTSKWIAVTCTVVSGQKKSPCPTSLYNKNMWPDKWKNVSQKIVCIPKYPHLCREYPCLPKLFHSGTRRVCAAISLHNEREVKVPHLLSQQSQS